MAKATKTIRYRLETDVRFVDWFICTKELYNEVTGFYLCLLLDKSHLLSLNQKDALSELEKLTIVGKERPEPEFLLPWDVPMVLRRACINQAIGAASGFFSARGKWESRKAKKLALGKPFAESPPVPPRRWNWNPVFYSGLHKEFTGSSIMLKLWTGETWAWVKMALKGQAIPDGWETQCPRNRHQREAHRAAPTYSSQI